MQRVAVVVVVHAHAAVQVAGVEVVRQVTERDDERGLRDDGAPPVLHHRELGGGLSRVAAGRACGRPRRVRPEHRVVETGDDLVGVHLGVPGRQRIHAGEAANEVAVGAGASERDGRATSSPETVAASGDDEAGDEPLHVPLERPRQRLVEVVDVEDQRALRRAVQAEVEEVGVAAQLHLEAGARPRGEVGGHDRRRAAVEAERVLEHARVADGQERLEPVGLLRGDDRDRVGAVMLGLPHAERLEGHRSPLRLARGLALLEGEMLLERERRARRGGDGPGGGASLRRRRGLLRRRRKAQRLRRPVVRRLGAPFNGRPRGRRQRHRFPGGRLRGPLLRHRLGRRPARRLLRGWSLLAAPGAHHRLLGVTPPSAGPSGAFLRPHTRAAREPVAPSPRRFRAAARGGVWSRGTRGGMIAAQDEAEGRDGQVGQGCADRRGLGHPWLP